MNQGYLTEKNIPGEVDMFDNKCKLLLGSKYVLDTCFLKILIGSILQMWKLICREVESGYFFHSTSSQRQTPPVDAKVNGQRAKPQLGWARLTSETRFV